MRFRPQVDPLEGRDTPSSFDPAASAVTFEPPPPAPGVPFSGLVISTPFDQAGLNKDPNGWGWLQSGAALDNAEVWGAPTVDFANP